MTGTWPDSRLTLWAWASSLAVCISLGPLVAEKGFLLAGALAGAGVALVGLLGRRLNVPIVVLVVAQLWWLVTWLTFSYAPSTAVAGLLPTQETVTGLRALVEQALTTANESAPPAPSNEGIEASLGLVMGLVAVVVDLLAVSWRRPALVGLVFLGVYMAPVALLAGEVPVLAFAPGALMFVLLLGAEQRDRLSHWGRQISITGSLLSVRDREQVTLTSLAQSGRRVGLGAVALAVVLPLFVPTLPRTFLADGPLSGGQGLGEGDGDGTVRVENPMLDLRRNLSERSTEVLATVVTDGGEPSYLRLASLDEFSNDSWVPSERDSDSSVDLERIPVPPGLTTAVDRDRVTTAVTLSDSFETTWLPTLYPTTRVDAEGDWGIDVDELDISARRSGLTGAGLTYKATSTLVLPTSQELTQTPLASDNMNPYVELPDDMSPVIIQQAEQVTRGLEDPFAQAEALQRWFRTEFRYSLAPGQGDGIETLERFVTTEKVGYCEQFAAAMALMARSLDIPARVAVGFLRPEQGEDGTWIYRGTDMHSWPELYFEGIGWVRFEPTPASYSGEAPVYEDVSEDETATATLPQNTRTLEEDPRTAADDAAATTTAGDDGPGAGQVLLSLLGVALLAGLAAAPRALRSARRRYRWRQTEGASPTRLPVAEAAWRELTDTALDLGVEVDDSATLRTAGRGLRARVDDTATAVDALNRLVVDAERSRFAPAGSREPRSAESAQADVHEVVARLAAGRTGGQRWRATWLPASLLRRDVLQQPKRTRRGAPLIRAEGRAQS